jgi:hypothetical protein
MFFNLKLIFILIFNKLVKFFLDLLEIYQKTPNEVPPPLFKASFFKK